MPFSAHTPGPALAAVGVGDPALLRILALDRRQPLTDEQIAGISRYLRKHEDPTCPVCFGAKQDEPCQTCGGTGLIMLRRCQAESLRELYDMRGFAGVLSVGSGKTLISLLAPTLLNARNPVLMIPSAHQEKTKRQFAAWVPAWHVRLPEILPYQTLGHLKHADDLNQIRPDLLICDEADYLRNLKGAAVAKRVNRYRAANPAATFCLMSGTLWTDQLMDSWHLTKWALGDKAPVPLQQADAERWAQALDGDLQRRERLAEGMLSVIPGGYHQWARESRGIVAVQGSDCNASIQISTWSPPLPDELRETIDAVARSGMRPDGELLDEWGLPDCLCQIAQGFYYVWDPLPPSWWLEPRSNWYRYVRDVLDEHLPEFDSPSQIEHALDWSPCDEIREGLRPTPPDPRKGTRLLAAWRAVKDEFVPNTVPVWLNDEPLHRVVERAQKGKTLVWVKHTAVGERLQQLGLPYYGEGTDPETAPPGQPIAVGMAHRDGKNLQAWDRSLCLVPPAKARVHEQKIGRIHRAGQRSPQVFVEYYAVIDYHHEVLDRVVRQARKVTESTGFAQKLTLADWTGQTT